MKNILLLSIVLMAQQGLAGVGFLKSALVREPQVIMIEENAGMTTFKFCHYKRSEKCITMGRRDGYTEEELLAVSKKILQKSKVNAVVKPILEIIGFVGPVAALSTPIGPVGAMFVGSASVSFSNIVGQSLSLSPDANKRLTKVLMPASSRFEQRMAFPVSILDFSNYLEEKLTEIDRCELVPFGMSRMKWQCSKFIPNNKFD